MLPNLEVQITDLHARLGELERFVPTFKPFSSQLAALEAHISPPDLPNPDQLDATPNAPDMRATPNGVPDNTPLPNGTPDQFTTTVVPANIPPWDDARCGYDTDNPAQLVADLDTNAHSCIVWLYVHNNIQTATMIPTSPLRSDVQHISV